MYQHYDGLIFDMDGTLLDTEAAHHRAWQQVLSGYGIEFDPAAIRSFYGSPTWLIAQVIVNLYQADLDPFQLARDKNAALITLLPYGVSPLPLTDVVKHYYGQKPMAVGTGTLHALADILLRDCGLHDYFDVIVGADDVTRHKPDPETFLRCARLMNIAPGKCIVFEDADFGIQAAKAAGMAVIDVRTLK